jgi:hypothetical protein
MTPRDHSQKRLLAPILFKGKPEQKEILVIDTAGSNFGDFQIDFQVAFCQ